MKYYFIVFLAFFMGAIHAQKKIKIGLLTNSVFQTSDSKLENGDASYLKKERFTDFKLLDWEKGWFIVNRYHNVVRIHSTNGLDYGTVTVNLYKNSGQEEHIDDIEGYTYEMVDGKLIKTKLDKSSIFKRTLNKHWDEVSFALPRVKQNTVIEYTYKVESPFWKIDDLIFQEDIPVLSYNAEITIPEAFRFNTYYQGAYRCNFDSKIKTASFNFAYSQRNSFGTKTNKTNTANMKLAMVVYKYQKNNIPPLKEEAYTNNIENYRSSVIFELASTELTKGNKKDYTTSWEKVAQTLYQSDRFGKPLLKINFLKEEGDRFRESFPNQKERAHAIFNHIKEQVAWNGDYSNIIDRSLKKAYEGNTGSSGEVNLLLVALLREAGLKANPVLSSTKNYKVPIFPTLEGFNHVLAAVSFKDDLTLYDATELYAKPGQLSENVRNWEGRLVHPDGTSQKIDLFSKKHVQKQTLVNINFSKEGLATGVFKERYLGDNEIAYRKAYSKIQESSLKTYFGDKYNLDITDQFKIQTDLDKSAEVSYTFESDELLEIINKKWHISPLLFLGKTENPFKAATRETPIDFQFPLIERKIINIEIPKDYVLQETPDPIKMVMTDNLGDYSLTISQNGKMIQVMSILKLNRTLFPPSQYETIRSFYTEILKRQNTPLVLIKK